MDQQQIVRACIADFAAEPGPLLEVLHAVQSRIGYVPQQAIATIAEGLNLSRADVHGVVTFYKFFRRSPAGRHVVQICRAESCLAMRGEALASHATRSLSAGFEETTADGSVTLESVYCLGNCACSPAIMIDGVPYGRVSPQRFDELIAALKDGSTARADRTRSPDGAPGAA